MSRSSRPPSLLRILLLSLTLTACAVSERPPRTAADTQKIRTILTPLQERDRRFTGLKGLASVHYGDRLFGVAGEAAISIKRPSNLRIDGLSPLGFYDYQVLMRHGDLTILWPASHRYLQSRLTAETGDLLLGIVPLEKEEDYRFKEKGGEIVLKGRRTTIRLREGLPVNVLFKDSNGATRDEVRYDDWREERGCLLPHQIVAKFKELRTRIEVEFHSIEPNPSFKASDFQVEIPKEAKPL